VRKVEIMTKIKQRLIREEKRRKEDELYAKQEEEEKKDDIDESPFREQIELCNLLIDYCSKLLPSHGKAEENVVKKDKTQIESALKGDEWKKENCQMVVNRKDVEMDFFVGKGKKGKKGKNTNQAKQPEAENE
jgi:hypothetical protein